MGSVFGGACAVAKTTPEEARVLATGPPHSGAKDAYAALATSAWQSLRRSVPESVIARNVIAGTPDHRPSHSLLVKRCKVTGCFAQMIRWTGGSEVVDDWLGVPPWPCC